jgi:mannose-1-phosphate guanylyltransferase
MKAFLLAAGLGTRLRPLTDTTPKCLVPIGGRPLLSYWMELLERHGFEEVLINLHHLPHVVRRFVATEPSSVRIRLFEEPALLGSAGTIRANRDWIADGEPFLVAYADNLTNANLGRLAAAHLAARPLLTMALFHAPEPTRCGIVELDGHGRIVDFTEKPSQPRSDLANAGLYVTDVRVVDRMPPGTPVDFGRDVLPGLIGEMHGQLLDGDIIDIGTPAAYLRAQRAVAAFSLSAARPAAAREAQP